MRQQRRRSVAMGLGVLLAVAVAGGPTAAEQYLVNAAAGPDGDSHGGNNDDPDAFASYQRSEKGGGAEFYEASADASSGSISASASHTDPLPFLSFSTRAAAGIEETIHFDELPADSVTLRATLGVGVTAGKTVGAASASARLDLGACYVTRSYNAALGPSSGSNCPGTENGTIELVLTRDQLIASGGQVDIEVHVSAQLESIGGLDGFATAGGGIPFARGAQPPAPGRVYLEMDPLLDHSFTGNQTFFLVPEPASPLLLAAGAATLALAGGRRGLRG